MKTPWYEAEYLSDGVTWIDELHVSPKGNIWLVEGADRDLLIDTGTGAGDLRGFVASLTDKPVQAIATVGYYDHAGGLHQFADTAIHRLDAHRVTRPDATNTVWGKYVDDKSFRVEPVAGFKANDYSMPAMKPRRLLEDGDTLELGDRSLSVVHLPGVTDGSIGLFESSTGFLFTGDTLLDADPPYDGEPPEESADANPGALSASMQRVAQLPVMSVFPGHGSPYDAARLRQILSDFFHRHPPAG